MLVSYAARTQPRPVSPPPLVVPYSACEPCAPVTRAPDPVPERYPDPAGVGVVAWLAASTIAAVLALACLGASWVGSVVLSSVTP